ncbi:MAG: hypothetical protein ACREGE_02300 [Candidatus Microsaccharimonas sp.]
MRSIDQRIRQDARHSRERRKAEYARDLEKLRGYIENDTINMIGRCDDHGVSKEDRADWLHLKTYDDTYHDYGQVAKRERTRTRIEALLELCHGDKGLLLGEVKRALDRYFPVASPHYTWAPELVHKELKSGKLRVSLRYRWQRVKRASEE